MPIRRTGNEVHPLVHVRKLKWPIWDDRTGGKQWMLCLRLLPGREVTVRLRHWEGRHLFTPPIALQIGPHNMQRCLCIAFASGSYRWPSFKPGGSETLHCVLFDPASSHGSRLDMCRYSHPLPLSVVRERLVISEHRCSCAPHPSLLLFGARPLTSVYFHRNYFWAIPLSLRERNCFFLGSLLCGCRRERGDTFTCPGLLQQGLL